MTRFWIILLLIPTLAFAQTVKITGTRTSIGSGFRIEFQVQNNTRLPLTGITLGTTDAEDAGCPDFTDYADRMTCPKGWTAEVDSSCAEQGYSWEIYAPSGVKVAPGGSMTLVISTRSDSSIYTACRFCAHLSGIKSKDADLEIRGVVEKPASPPPSPKPVRPAISLGQSPRSQCPPGTPVDGLPPGR